jgi:hypothetical protein
MNTIQRENLDPFELLKVIDTDKNSTWIYRNGMWQRLFSPETTNLAIKNQTLFSNNSESWKKFDEESKPHSISNETNQSSADFSINNFQSPNYRYEAISKERIQKNGVQFSFYKNERLAYIKIFTKNQKISFEGVNLLAFTEENSVLLKPLNSFGENVFLNLIVKDEHISTRLNNIDEINGILIAYINN